MPLFSAIIAWCTAGITVIKPFVPAVLVSVGYTVGTHIAAFGGSWFLARRYSANCIGTGFGGLYNFYWKMASPTCTTLLFSHVGLFSVAIASLFMTIIIFSWFFYKIAKNFVTPTIKEIKYEIGDKKQIQYKHSKSKVAL
tara:strand:+ start:2216 stop:2635 length:420 start_codon:yes stop_codon:yes gene_type:complete